MVTDHLVADLIRVADLSLTAICVGAYGYTLALYLRNRRARLSVQQSSTLLLLTFSASYVLLLVAGAAIDIQRLHLGLSPYTPIHLAAVLFGIWSLYLSIRVAIALWRQGKKL